MCKLTVNVNSDTIIKLDDTALTFNKIAPKLEETDMSRSERAKKNFRKFKKVSKKRVLYFFKKIILRF